LPWQGIGYFGGGSHYASELYSSRDLNLFFTAAKQAPLFEALPELSESAPAEQTVSAEAKEQVEVLKGNGKGNGAVKVEPDKPKANGVADMKAEVKRRQGGVSTSRRRGGLSAIK
jgi:hypothetical protein